jgi:hypothetical protein
MTTDAAHGLLELHVLSAGYGESIILHLPDGKWGVVDCYATSVNDPDTNAAIRFLKERRVSELEFLCLTHPHDDHYRGMSQFFDCFADIRYFWRFAGATYEGLRRLAKIDAKEGKTDLCATLRRVGEQRIAKSLRVAQMIDVKHLYPEKCFEESALRIWSIAPSSNQVEAFEETLAKCFDKSGRLRPKRPQLDANMVSAALLVVFGSTRLILGGDVEGPAWKEILQRMNADLAAHAVKVSHHGSTTGYTEGLWAAFAKAGSPCAIITPFQRYRLPEKAAVRHIAEHTKNQFTTCLPAISFERSSSAGFLGGCSLAAKIAFGTKFSSYEPKQPHATGVCSFTFDNQGDCVAMNMLPPAGRLAV